MDSPYLRMRTRRVGCAAGRQDGPSHRCGGPHAAAHERRSRRGLRLADNSAENTSSPRTRTCTDTRRTSASRRPGTTRVVGCSTPSARVPRSPPSPCSTTRRRPRSRLRAWAWFAGTCPRKQHRPRIVRRPTKWSAGSANGGSATPENVRPRAAPRGCPDASRHAPEGAPGSGCPAPGTSPGSAEIANARPLRTHMPCLAPSRRAPLTRSHQP